jgi:hypothetical protein
MARSVLAVIEPSRGDVEAARHISSRRVGGSQFAGIYARSKVRWPKPKSLKRGMALPRLCAASAISAPIFPADRGRSWEIPHLRPGSLAPRLPQVTRSWPLLPPTQPRP